MANELKRTSQQQLPRQQAILLREEISQNGASGHLCFHFPNRGLISEVERAYCSEMSSRLLLKLLPTPCAFPRGRWTILKNKSIHTQKATHTRQWVFASSCPYDPRASGGWRWLGEQESYVLVFQFPHYQNCHSVLRGCWTGGARATEEPMAVVGNLATTVWLCSHLLYISFSSAV